MIHTTSGGAKVAVAINKKKKKRPPSSSSYSSSLSSKKTSKKRKNEINGNSSRSGAGGGDRRHSRDHGDSHSSSSSSSSISSSSSKKQGKNGKSTVSDGKSDKKKKAIQFSSIKNSQAYRSNVNQDKLKTHARPMKKIKIYDGEEDEYGYKSIKALSITTVINSMKPSVTSDDVFFKQYVGYQTYDSSLVRMVYKGEVDDEYTCIPIKFFERQATKKAIKTLIPNIRDMLKKFSDHVIKRYEKYTLNNGEHAEHNNLLSYGDKIIEYASENCLLFFSHEALMSYGFYYENEKGKRIVLDSRLLISLFKEHVRKIKGSSGGGANQKPTKENGSKVVVSDAHKKTKKTKKKRKRDKMEDRGDDHDRDDQDENNAVISDSERKKIERNTSLAVLSARLSGESTTKQLETEFVLDAIERAGSREYFTPECYAVSKALSIHAGFLEPPSNQKGGRKPLDKPKPIESALNESVIASIVDSSNAHVPVCNTGHVMMIPKGSMESLLAISSVVTSHGGVTEEDRMKKIQNFSLSNLHRRERITVEQVVKRKMDQMGKSSTKKSEPASTPRAPLKQGASATTTTIASTKEKKKKSDLNTPPLTKNKEEKKEEITKETNIHKSKDDDGRKNKKRKKSKNKDDKEDYQAEDEKENKKPENIVQVERGDPKDNVDCADISPYLQYQQSTEHNHHIGEEFSTYYRSEDFIIPTFDVSYVPDTATTTDAKTNNKAVFRLNCSDKTFKINSMTMLKSLLFESKEEFEELRAEVKKEIFSYVYEYVKESPILTSNNNDIINGDKDLNSKGSDARMKWYKNATVYISKCCPTLENKKILSDLRSFIFKIVCDCLEKPKKVSGLTMSQRNLVNLDDDDDESHASKKKRVQRPSLSVMNDTLFPYLGWQPNSSKHAKEGNMKDQEEEEEEEQHKRCNIGNKDTTLDNIKLDEEMSMLDDDFGLNSSEKDTDKAKATKNANENNNRAFKSRTLQIYPALDHFCRVFWEYRSKEDFDFHSALINLIWDDKINKMKDSYEDVYLKMKQFGKSFDLERMFLEDISSPKNFFQRFDYNKQLLKIYLTMMDIIFNPSCVNYMYSQGFAFMNESEVSKEMKKLK